MHHNVAYGCFLLIVSQNLREEVTMDVNEDDEGTQRVKRVPDHGIEVDFDSLGEDDLEVGDSFRGAPFTCAYL